MNSRICYICMIMLCISTGCKQREQTNTSISTEITEISVDNNKQADDSTKQTECKNGSTFKDNKCICEDGSELLGNGWYCLKEGQKCFAEAGCISGENTWPMALLSHNFLEQRKLRTHNGFRHLGHEIIVENFV